MAHLHLFFLLGFVLAQLALFELQIRAASVATKIVAPYNCVVTRRLVNPGDLVQAATSTRTAPLFTCQEIDMVRVFADAPEASAADPGLPAEVKLYGEAPLTVHGAVTRIATALDPAADRNRPAKRCPGLTGGV